MQCRVLIKRNHAVVVSFVDAGKLKGRIIPEIEMRGKKAGEQVEIEYAALERGIEYGLDFELLTGDITISAANITQALRSHGIWTQEDLQSKAQEATAAIASLVGLVHGRIVKDVRNALGG